MSKVLNFPRKDREANKPKSDAAILQHKIVNCSMANELTLRRIRVLDAGSDGRYRKDINAATARLLEVALLLERIEMQEDDLNGR